MGRINVGAGNGNCKGNTKSTNPLKRKMGEGEDWRGKTGEGRLEREEVKT